MSFLVESFFFPFDLMFFYGVKGFGIEATADQIGLGLTAVAAAGVTAHAIVTNIQKRKLIKNQIN